MEIEKSTVQQFCNGSREAFEALYRLESARLGRFIRRYVRSEDLAEDVFQEVWYRVWQSRGQLRDAARFIAWLYQIARNCIFGELRRLGRNPEITLFGRGQNDEATDPSLEVPDHRPGPRHWAELREETLLVEALIAQLDPQAQEILALRFGGGLALREIAEVLELPIGTVCSKVSRSLRTIRSEMARQELRGKA